MAGSKFCRRYVVLEKTQEKVRNEHLDFLRNESLRRIERQNAQKRGASKMSLKARTEVELHFAITNDETVKEASILRCKKLQKLGNKL